MSRDRAYPYYCVCGADVAAGDVHVCIAPAYQPRPSPSTITEDSPGVADALEAFLAHQHLGTTAALLEALQAFVRAR